MTDYCTIADVNAILRTTLSSSTIPTSTVVSSWISDASSEIDLISDNLYSSTVVSSTYLDYDGEGILRLPHSNLLSIEELKYNYNTTGYSPSWYTLEEGFDKNYLLYSDEGELEFISGVNSTNKVLPLRGNKKFCVSYTYGSTNYPRYISRLCALMVAKNTILSLINSQANSEGGSIQVGTISISDPTMFSVNYIKSIDNEIKDLQSKIGLDFKTIRYTRNYG